MHLVHGVLAPVAGAAAAAGIDGGSSTSSMTIAGLLGGANAFAMLGLRATARGASSAVSAGMLNPVLSLIEDAVAVTGLALAFVAPFAVAIAALLVTVTFVLLVGRGLRAHA